MSALSVEVPHFSPEIGFPQPVSPEPRRLDVVPTRGQRRARPKSFYALITVAGLFAILVAQLLLSIVVSDGAYQISALQQEQKELFRDHQTLLEQINVLESPQHLAANAEQLGMVTNSNTAYLRLSDGAILGSPAAATASGAIMRGADGGPLVPNQLLTGIPLTTLTPVSSTTPANGAPQSVGTNGSVTSIDEGLPSPVNR
ncbi:MAG: hypothetical protein ABIW32_02735 [Terrimesophilobacter sp.]